MVSRFLFGLVALSATAFVGTALADAPRTLQIIVSKDTQSLTVYDGDTVVSTSRVSTGKAGHTTPSGIFSILEKRKYHESNIYSNAPMPFMQRLTWSGIALHESGHVPGYPASHGCVRMPGQFAKTLFQMTRRGDHVIVSDRPVTPARIEHANLFRPDRPLLLSDVELRPSTIDASLKPVEVAMNEPPRPAPPRVAASKPDMAPLRILITRRGERETVRDVQTALNELGFDAGKADGYLGNMTISAVNGYKRWKGLTAKGPVLSDEFLDALYHSAGKSAPPAGQLMVRQNFEPLFDIPVEIAEPHIALGTHFIEATRVDHEKGTAEWYGVTLENHLPGPTMKRLGIETAADLDAFNAIGRTLDRIGIPDEVRERLNTMLARGSSITISDTGHELETGKGTDFIVVTRKALASGKRS